MVTKGFTHMTGVLMLVVGRRPQFLPSRPFHRALLKIRHAASPGVLQDRVETAMSFLALYWKSQTLTSTLSIGHTGQPSECGKGLCEAIDTKIQRRWLVPILEAACHRDKEHF